LSVDLLENCSGSAGPDPGKSAVSFPLNVMDERILSG
jgi:hypothetical protein